MTREEIAARMAVRELARLTPEQRESLLLDWWPLGPDDPEWERLPVELQRELRTRDAPADALDARYDPLLVLAIAGGYRGVRNDYLQRKAEALGIRVAEIHGEPERLEVCPCCCYRTLPEQGGYDICPVCFWEDDGLRRLEGYSGPNRMTLGEGRANFAALGACAPSAVGVVRKELREAYVRDEAKGSG